jgi:hypothetical protein
MRITLATVGRTLTRPYPVTIPMVVLVSLVPIYLVIADRAKAGPVYAPALALDRLLPLTPVWALVYGALYFFLIVLPVFVIQQDEVIRRTVWAYITVWTVAYIGFLLYPTVAPRSETVVASTIARSVEVSPFGPTSCFDAVTRSSFSALRHRANTASAIALAGIPMSSAFVLVHLPVPFWPAVSST